MEWTTCTTCEEEMSEEKRKDTVEIIKQHYDEYYWIRKAPNGEIVGKSHESFKTFNACWKNLEINRREYDLFQE